MFHDGDMHLKQFKNYQKKTLLFVFIVTLIGFGSIVVADDNYKPYIHKANVPDHPKIKLYGSYQTNLFPGAATYSYPIEVPQGTNGLQPSISISYNSQTAKQRPGILGAGWSLTQNYIYRDVNSTPSNTTDDEFKLILNGGFYDLVYDSSDSLHHTKIESFFRIQNLTGAPNTYGTYWVVTTKEGTQFRFGYNTDSELASNTGRNYALRWSLDQVQDTHDNKIFYSYSENPNTMDNGTSYISQILYNNDQKRKVSFVYETSVRPDVRTIYDQGNLLNETRRLSEIRILVNDSLVRKYQFEYSNLTGERSVSALSKIKFIGADNSSILHQILFDYHASTSQYTNASNLYEPPPSPYLFDAIGAIDEGVRLVDFNNDGFVDIVKGDASSPATKKSWFNNRTGWNETTSWILPEYIVDSSNTDNGIRFVDFDGDGFLDILRGNNGLRNAWRNNGTGWVNASSVWNPPIDFYTGGELGVVLIDFNGDGRTDILKASNTHGNQSYMNNGNGWTNTTSQWQSPDYFLFATNDAGSRIEDVNADGLPDIIRGYDREVNVRKTWLNNGSGWTLHDVWSPPVVFTSNAKTDTGVRFWDVNGDGLPDLIEDYADATETVTHAYINNGNGWTQNDSWVSPEHFTVNGRNYGRRLADANGDGFADIIISYTESGVTQRYTQVKNFSTPFMLKSITNELGGVTTISYGNSTSFNNTGNDSLSDIGFNVFVVKNITYNNSLSGAFNSLFNYSYNYSGGRYDYNDTDFRGFAVVNETLPDSSLIIHRFHQDDALKGREYLTEVYNSSGSIFSEDETLFNFTNTTVNVTGNYFKVFTAAQISYSHDGSSTNPRITNVTYAYDSFGNVISRRLLGDVNASGDEKYENYSYVINTTNWIVDKLSLYRLFSDNSTKVKEIKYSYDGQVFNKNATKGDVTAVEQWNSNGTHPIARFEYDGFGNVIKEIDPLGRQTSYTYGLRDTTFTLIDKITNALDHQTDFKYDLGTGNLLWKKQNGIYTYFTYDTFGRISKEIQPFDSSDLPTKSYNYSFDGAAPESIVITQRISGNRTYDTYFYYDGLGNFIQFKKPSDGNRQIVKNLFYDGLGRVSAESNPYFTTFSTGLTTTQNSNFINYTYDSLSRVTNVTNPDGNSSKIVFNRWNITAYDENNHRKMYVTDAYGRIVNVLEYNNDPVLKQNFETDAYITVYQYDTSDNLVKITDALGNQFAFVYDSLGRRIELRDPDLGNWSYIYDVAGNLIRQVQVGGGNLVTGDGYYREYNELNQLTKIRNGSTVTAGQLENYTYDPFGQRIKIMRNDSVKTIVYTPFKELTRIVNTSGTYDFVYVYDENGLIAKIDPGNTKRYYHLDHLGSTSLVTRQTGSSFENTHYSPYGEVLSGGVKEDKLYTGQFSDDLADQYYYGCRYYKQGTGQFVQPDQFIQDPYNPQNLNRYAYTLNNPYKYTDPTGCIIQFGQLAIGTSLIASYFTVVYSDVLTQLVTGFISSIKAPSQLNPQPLTPVDPAKPSTITPPTTGGNVAPSINPSNQPSPSDIIGETIERGMQGVTQASSQGRQTTITESFWDKGTFQSSKDSITYHNKIHGKGLTSEEQTKRGIDLWNKYKNGDPSIKTVSEKVPIAGGREGVKLVDRSNNWFGIYTKEGKIVSTGFRK